MSMLRTFTAGKLSVTVYDSEVSMGRAAAQAAAAEILRLQKEKDEINIIFAAAISQNEMLDALRTYDDIQWGKINAFHMDEYHGLPEGDPHRLSEFLQSHFLAGVPVKNRFFLNSSCVDTEEECRRYSGLLEKYPCDIVFLGIGDNGHLAFNDPHVADFHDSVSVKTVAIDKVSKLQQVHAGNFPNVESVPSIAFTVTIPALLRSRHMFCVVPTVDKAQAVHDALEGPVGERCPASILRYYENAALYLDKNSASLLTI